MPGEPRETARRIFEQKYPEADCLFLAGSVIRAEATPYSDLDLVVLFKRVDCAYRESFIFDDWRVEAFVHDVSTLKYFSIHKDKEVGRPALPHMVLEGQVIPAHTELAKTVQSFARELISEGPPALTPEEIRLRRYLITDKVDDVRQPRSKSELIATGCQLYGAISDFYFRSQGLWSAEGKTILRKLKAHDPKFHDEFVDAFRNLFEAGDVAAVIALTEKILHPQGGFLFDGFRLSAPQDWRLDEQKSQTGSVDV